MTSSFGSDPRAGIQSSTDPMSFGMSSLNGNRFESRLVNRPLSSVTSFENKSNVVINGNSNIVGSSVEMNRFIRTSEVDVPQTINVRRSEFENNVSRRRTNVELPADLNDLNALLDPVNNIPRSEQNSGSRDPNSGSRDPNNGSRDPNSGSRDPNSGSRDPNSGSRDPNSGSRDSNSVIRDPNSVIRDPNSVNRDLNSVIRDPNSVNQDPNSVNRDPNSVNQDPNSGSRDPNSVIRDPNSGSRDPNSVIRDPNSGSLEPTSNSQDPGSGSQRGRILFVDGNSDDGGANTGGIVFPDTGNSASRTRADPSNSNTQPNVNINLNFPANPQLFNANPTLPNQPGLNNNLPLANQPVFNTNIPRANQPRFNTNFAATNQSAFNTNIATTIQPGFNTNFAAANQPGFNTNFAATNRPVFAAANQPGFNTNFAATNQPGFAAANQPGLNTNFAAASQPGFNTNFAATNQPGFAAANQPGFNTNFAATNQPGFNTNFAATNQSAFNTNFAAANQPSSDASSLQRPTDRQTGRSDPSRESVQGFPRFDDSNQPSRVGLEATDPARSRQIDPNFLNSQTAGFNRQLPTIPRIQRFDDPQTGNMATFDPDNMDMIDSNRMVGTRASQNEPVLVFPRFESSNQASMGNEETDPGIMGGAANIPRGSMTSQTFQPSNVAGTNSVPRIMGVQTSAQTSRFSQNFDVGGVPQTTDSPGVRRFIKKTTTVRRFLVDPSENQTNTASLPPNTQSSGPNTGNFARMNFNIMDTSLNANNGVIRGDPGTMNRFVSSSNTANVNRDPQVMGVPNSLQTSRFSQSIRPVGNFNTFTSVSTTTNDEDRQPVLTRFAAASDPQNRNPNTAQAQNSFTSGSSIDPGSIESRFGSNSGNLFRSLQSVEGSSFGNSGFPGASVRNPGIGGFVTANVGETTAPQESQAPQSSIFDRFGGGAPSASGFPAMTANDNGLGARGQTTASSSATGNSVVSRNGDSNGVTIIETSRRNVVLSSENGDGNGGSENTEVTQRSNPPPIFAVNDTVSCLR